MKLQYNIGTGLAIILFSVTGLFASGDLHHHTDPLLKTFIMNPRQLPDVEYQHQLVQQPAWQNFVKGHKTWMVKFNEHSGMPHKAVGSPVAVPGSDARSTAENFLSGQLNTFRIPVNDLKFRSVSTNLKYQYVNYLQHYQGLEVLFTNVQIRMTHDYRVNQFTLDCYPSITISTSPSLTEAAAIANATYDVKGIQSITVTPELKVLPIPGHRTTTFHLVYEIEVDNIDDEGIPGKYYTLVDASSGAILYRDNKIIHIANTDVNVS